MKNLLMYNIFFFAVGCLFYVQRNHKLHKTVKVQHKEYHQESWLLWTCRQQSNISAYEKKISSISGKVTLKQKFLFKETPT